MSRISDLVSEFEGLKEAMEGLGTQAQGYVEGIDEAISEANSLGVDSSRLEAAKARAEQLVNEITSVMNAVGETRDQMAEAGESEGA